MKKQTALVLVTIAVLLILTALSTRGEGGGILGRWIAEFHGTSGH